MARELTQNTASIAAIPSTNITPGQRAMLQRRVTNGENVYAYPAGPQEGREHGPLWNLWDTDTRIPLPLLTLQWDIIFTIHIDDDCWEAVLKRGDQQCRIVLVIHPNYTLDKSQQDYFDRAERVIRYVIGHLSSYDADPRTYHMTHH